MLRLLLWFHCSLVVIGSDSITWIYCISFMWMIWLDEKNHVISVFGCIILVFILKFEIFQFKSLTACGDVHKSQTLSKKNHWFFHEYFLFKLEINSGLFWFSNWQKNLWINVEFMLAISLNIFCCFIHSFILTLGPVDNYSRQQSEIKHG